MTGVQVTASQVQSIGRPFHSAHNKPLSRSTRGTHFKVHVQAARAQTLTKRKAMGMKGVVSMGGLNEDVVLLITKAHRSATELVQYISLYLVTSG